MASAAYPSPFQPPTEELQREIRLLRKRLGRDAEDAKQTVEELRLKVNQLTAERKDLASQLDEAQDETSFRPFDASLALVVRPDRSEVALEEAESRIAALSHERLQTQRNVEDDSRILERGFRSLNGAHVAFQALLRDRGILHQHPPPSANIRGLVNTLPLVQEMEQEQAIEGAAQFNVAGNQPMDPVVAAFLDSQWTSEDEAYASDEFREHFAAYQKANAAGVESSSFQPNLISGIAHREASDLNPSPKLLANPKDPAGDELLHSPPDSET